MKKCDGVTIDNGMTLCRDNADATLSVTTRGPHKDRNETMISSVCDRCGERYEHRHRLVKAIRILPHLRELFDGKEPPTRVRRKRR